MRPHIQTGKTAGQTLRDLVKAMEAEGYHYTPFTDVGTDDYRLLQAAMREHGSPGFSIDLHTIGNNAGSLVTVGASVAPFRSDRFDLLFGLRYDNEELRNIASATTDTVDPLPPQFGYLAPLLGTETSTIDAAYDAWLPKAGVRWNLDPDTNLSFVVQRAYRAACDAASEDGVRVVLRVALEVRPPARHDLLHVRGFYRIW